MTCSQVLGLIDAGPFADYPPAHVDAAWQHARHCPTCGPALKTATALTAELGALPEPTPPSSRRPFWRALSGSSTSIPLQPRR